MIAFLIPNPIKRDQFISQLCQIITAILAKVYSYGRLFEFSLALTFQKGSTITVFCAKLFPYSTSIPLEKTISICLPKITVIIQTSLLHAKIHNL